MEKGGAYLRHCENVEASDERVGWVVMEMEGEEQVGMRHKKVS
jgi:hypothetical protein